MSDDLTKMWSSDALINHDALESMSQEELNKVLDILKKLD